jgi:hypothetical protein
MIADEEMHAAPRAARKAGRGAGRVPESRAADGNEGGPAAGGNAGGPAGPEAPVVAAGLVSPVSFVTVARPQPGWQRAG